MPSRLSLKQQEKIFKDLLCAYYLPKGFKYFHEYQNSNFRHYGDTIVLQNTLYASSSGWHSFVNEISFKKIESLIVEIGLPNIDFSTYTENDLLCTVRDNGFNKKFPTDGDTSIETEEECKLYCQRIIEYMETDGKAFIEKYSYLPNVLAEMDRLESEGKYWTGLYGKGGILCGMGDAFYRGLIISKLCNDKNFENKLETVSQIFEEDKQWLPGYKKLKERLKTIEPIYNV